MATAPEARQRPLKFTHPDDMPDLYALTGYGTCMEPEIPDGSVLAFDKRETPVPGDVVGLIFTREAAATQRVPGMIKKLAMALPPFDLSNGLTALVIVDQINPPRRYAIPTTDLLAVHKCVGMAESNGDGTARYRPRVTGGPA